MASAGHRHQRTSLRAASSPPSSPTLSPTVSISSVAPLPAAVQRLQPLRSQIPSVPRRLLVPTSVPKYAALDEPPRPVKGKSSNGKLTRARSDSAPPELRLPQTKSEQQWLDVPCRFEVVEESLQLVGYQIHAVEKWMVERTKATTLLTVYTGDPKDKITVTALAPSSTLSSSEAHREWEKAIQGLRQGGARPREVVQTDKGVIMVTSLANFRSDYTVVYIPGGDFIAHREQLYVNINLLRMGCSGRSALTLQEPSDTTKDRFIGMYQFRDDIRPPEHFKPTVLALVKLIQCGLSLFEMFPIGLEEQNGLLCDVTLEGIKKWVGEIGEPYMKIEPMERVVDPSSVSALISLALSMRAKLNAIGLPMVPKDPFLHPRRFTRNLATFVNQRLFQPPSNSPSSSQIMCQHAYLNLPLIKRIDLSYDKYKSSEAYKLHRVVLNKLDDFTSATTSAITSSKHIGHGHSLSLSSKDRDAEGLLEGTSDLAAFVAKVNLLRGKECAASVRCLWTGRLDQLERKRREGVRSDAEEEREREKSETDDDGEVLGALPWSGKVQKKIESWAGREFGKSRAKKTSIDSKEIGQGEARIPPPSVVISRDPDEPVSGLSSGQVSPTSPSASLIALGGFSSAHTSALNVDDAEYFRRLQHFNQVRPSLLGTRRPAIASWSDPISAGEVVDDADLETARAAGFPPFGLTPPAPSSNAWASGSRADLSVDQGFDRMQPGKQPLPLRLKRSYSFDDRLFVRVEDCLSFSRMQVDVDLCAQCLIMRRRKFHLETVATALQVLLQTSSTSNDILRKYHEEHTDLIMELAAKCQIAADIEEAVSTTDAASADTDALIYEAHFLDVQTLWRMAQGPRHRVFAIRDRVFGTRGRRYASDSHGQFNRVQKRLDGQERLVDFLGRTESEVEEESELPLVMPEGGEESSEDEEGEERRARGENGEEGQLKVLSMWLLTLFTKWGRVLGVRGAASPAPAEVKQVVPSEDNDDLPADSTEKPVRPRYTNGNGLHNRLSTVGEEDESMDDFLDDPFAQDTTTHART